MTELANYVVLEQALKKRLVQSWRAYAAKAFTPIRKAIGDKKFDLARHLAGEVDLAQIGRENKEWIKYTLLATAKFGAAIANPNGPLAVSVGTYENLLNHLYRSFDLYLTHAGNTRVYNQLIASIANAEKEATAQKADVAEAPAVDEQSSGVRFVKEFTSFYNSGDAALQLISSLHSSRLAAWGFTAEAEVLGISRYQLVAVLDNRTSDFCQMINGREFDVTDARQKLDEVLSAQDPEDLKILQPWPDQDSQSIADYQDMSEDELVGEGLMIPPFHPSCFIGETAVNSPFPITSASKRFYDGPVVTISIPGGKQFTCTPNHPILTPRGWVAAGLLQYGDELVQYIGADVAFIDPQKDGVPSLIKDVVDAFFLGDPSVVCEVPISSPDFHGDGAYSKVASVRTDRLLRRKLNSVGGQNDTEILLVSGFWGRVSFSAYRRIYSLLQRCRLATSSFMRSVGGLLDFFRSHTHPSQLSALTHGTDSASSLSYKTNNDVPINPVGYGEGSKGYSAIIGKSYGQAVNVLFARHSMFSGYVYNLETESGWYVTEGIVAHNCRTLLAKIGTHYRLAKPNDDTGDTIEVDDQGDDTDQEDGLDQEEQELSMEANLLSAFGGQGSSEPLTEDTFAEYGVTASAKQVDFWNAYIGISPGLLFGLMADVDPQDIFDELIDAGLNVDTTAGEIGVSLDGPLAGDDTSASIHQILDPVTGTVYNNYIDIAHADPAEAEVFIRDVYTGLADVASRIEANDVVTDVPLGTVAEHAIFGFLPDQAEWDTMRNDILDNLDVDGELADVAESLDEDQFATVVGLLESSDPKAVWALATLPWEVFGVPLADLLFDGYTFQATLDTTDPEAMARYAMYFPQLS